MSNNDYNKLELDTSVVFRENNRRHGQGDSDVFQNFAKVFVVTALLSSSGIVDSANTSYYYNEEGSTVSVSLSTFNDNFLVKSSFSATNSFASDSILDSIDDENYDEAEEILSYAHPKGIVREMKMKITGHIKGSINISDELLEDFDYE